MLKSWPISRHFTCLFGPKLQVNTREILLNLLLQLLHLSFKTNPYTISWSIFLCSINSLVVAVNPNCRFLMDFLGANECIILLPEKHGVLCSLWYFTGHMVPHWELSLSYFGIVLPYLIWMNFYLSWTTSHSSWTQIFLIYIKQVVQRRNANLIKEMA